MRIQIVFKLVGQLLLIFATLILVPFIYGVIFEEAYYSYVVTTLVTAILGGLGIYYGKESASYSLRDGFLVVSSLWIISSILGSMPFWLSGVTPNYEDALFEAVSGLTATGASVIPNIDEIPKTFILWRSIMHWVGGMGIIVLVIAFLKNLGADAAHLFNAEASVPRPGVVFPRIKSLAAKLWRIYVFFTVLCFICLLLSGLNTFDALNMTFSTVATGGFTPHQDGTFLYSDNWYIKITLIVFMTIAGGNFSVYYNGYSNGMKYLFKDVEFMMYLFILFVGSCITFTGLAFFNDSTPFVPLFGDALFTYISMQTGSGFAVADYDKWPAISQTALFLSTFLGGCSGSTTGGIKIIRILILFKSSILWLKKAIHPDIVQIVRFGGKPMQNKWILMTQQFFFLYMAIFAVSTLLIAATGIPVGESMQCVAGILGNVGLAFGQFGPTDSFSTLHPVAKITCVVDMILGRLELFTIMVLLLPSFWQGYFVKQNNVNTKRWKYMNGDRIKQNTQN